MFAIKLVTLTINMCSINNFMNFAFLSKCDFGENFLDLSKDILLITPKKLTHIKEANVISYHKAVIFYKISFFKAKFGVHVACRIIFNLR